jgi:hypothetical protein
MDTDAEREVRAAWVDVRFESLRETSQSWQHKPVVPLSKLHGRVLAFNPANGSHWILSGNSNVPFEASHALPEVAAWQAALDFTNQCKQEIAKIDEEIGLQRRFESTVTTCSDMSAAILDRTIKRLQSIRAGLVQGMKGVEDGH